MINTYQTSLAPPPLPPRLSRSDTVLIQAPVPSPGHSKPLIRFLAGVVVLNLLVCVGGFILMYTTGNMTTEKGPQAQKLYLDRQKTAGKNFPSSEKQNKTLAHMVVKKRSHAKSQTSSGGYLEWDINHSVYRNINYYRNTWLTIWQPGDYFIYSRVTFSKGDLKRPLASLVKLRKTETGEEKEVMKAYCSLSSRGEDASIPQLCTASQEGVISLEDGNQLSVWVQDLSLVDYSEEATVFGMYRL